MWCDLHRVAWLTRRYYGRNLLDEELSIPELGDDSAVRVYPTHACSLVGRSSHLLVSLFRYSVLYPWLSSDPMSGHCGSEFRPVHSPDLLNFSVWSWFTSSISPEEVHIYVGFAEKSIVPESYLRTFPHGSQSLRHCHQFSGTHHFPIIQTQNRRLGHAHFPLQDGKVYPSK